MNNSTNVATTSSSSSSSLSSSSTETATTSNKEVCFVFYSKLFKSHQNITVQSAASPSPSISDSTVAPDELITDAALSAEPAAGNTLYIGNSSFFLLAFHCQPLSLSLYMYHSHWCGWRCLLFVNCAWSGCVCDSKIYARVSCSRQNFE